MKLKFHRTKQLITLILVAIPLFFGFSSKLKSYETQVEFEDGVILTLSVSPMFSLQSDWHRTLTVTRNGRTIHRDLFEDTGWWRGSNLYRHRTGAYVIDEGQGGCLVFAIDPVLDFQSQRDVACEKSDTAQARSGNQSKYLNDMQYLGTFLEISTEPHLSPIEFFTSDMIDEPQLPTPPKSE